MDDENKNSKRRSCFAWFGFLVVVIVLGFLTSFVVAWGFAYLKEQPTYPREASTYLVRWNNPWMITPARSTGIYSLWWLNLYTDSRISPTETSAETVVLDAYRKGLIQRPGSAINNLPEWGTFQLGPPNSLSVNTLGADLGFGFPFLCTWYRVVGEVYTIQGSNPIIASRNEVLNGGWLVGGQVDVRSAGFRALPFWPLWPGLALNTLIYSVLWFAVLFFPSEIRARRRKHVGACTYCGYDLRGTLGNTCPECGLTRLEDMK